MLHPGLLFFIVYLYDTDLCPFRNRNGSLFSNQLYQIFSSICLEFFKF